MKNEKDLIRKIDEIIEILYEECHRVDKSHLLFHVGLAIGAITNLTEERSSYLTHIENLESREDLR